MSLTRAHHYTTQVHSKVIMNKDKVQVLEQIMRFGIVHLFSN